MLFAHAMSGVRWAAYAGCKNLAFWVSRSIVAEPPCATVDVVDLSVRVTFANLDVGMPVAMIPYWVDPAVWALTASVRFTPLMS